MLVHMSDAVRQLWNQNLIPRPAYETFAHLWCVGWALRVVTRPVFGTLSGQVYGQDSAGATSIIVEDFEFEWHALAQAELALRYLKRLNSCIIEVTFFMRARNQHFCEETHRLLLECYIECRRM